MALVACRECGSEISDSAATCPRCGVAAPAGTGTITFVRPSLQSGAIGVEVFVDGKPYGRLRALSTLAVPVTPGDHHVELQTKRGQSSVGTIRAATGDTKVTVKLHALTGAPKMS